MFTAMLDNVNFTTPTRPGTLVAVNTSSTSSQNPANGFPKVLQPVRLETPNQNELRLAINPELDIDHANFLSGFSTTVG